METAVEYVQGKIFASIIATVTILGISRNKSYLCMKQYDCTRLTILTWSQIGEAAPSVG